MCDVASLMGLYCVGLGPGDAQQITLKALNILQRAHRIFVPGAKSMDSLALQIVKELPGVSAELCRIDFSLAPRIEDRLLDWKKSSELIIQEIGLNGYCVCVTLGDPGLYSTMHYLQRAVISQEPSIPMTLVAGITSVQAVSEITGTIATGNESVGISPLPRSCQELMALLSIHDRLFVMKIGSRLRELIMWMEPLEEEYSVSLVRRAGLSDQEVCVGKEELKRADGRLSIAVIEKKTERGVQL